MLPRDVKKHNELFAAIHLAMVNSQVTSLKEENESLKEAMMKQFQVMQAAIGQIQNGMACLLEREKKIAAKEEREEKEKEAFLALFSHDGPPPPVNAKFRWTNWNSNTHNIT